MNIADFPRAVAEARRLSTRCARLRIISVESGRKIPGAFDLRVTPGKDEHWDSSAAARYADGGTALQKKPDGSVFFCGDIAEIDAVSGRVVVLAQVNSPHPRPDESLTLELRPVDYLSALDNFAQNMDVKRTDAFLEIPEETRRPRSSRGTGKALGEKSLRAAQLKALKTALSERLSFIWGPPGTGKSYTLGAVVANLRERGESVLLLSTTNVAVDVATFAADDACNRIGKPLKPRELVRYAGDLKNLEEFQKRPHLCSYTETLKKYDGLQKDLDKQIADVSREIKRNDIRNTFELHAKKKKLQNDKKILAEERKKELEDLKKTARILAVTFTSAIFSKILEVRRFDAIVVDEASQIPLAAWVYLTYRHMPGARFPRIIVAGDPLQLQPIPPPVGKKTPFRIRELIEKWFARNIYSYVGLTSPEDAFPHVVFLNVQSRMREEICEAVSRAFYSGKLRGCAKDLLDKKLPPLLILNVADTPNAGGEKNTNAASREAVCRYVASIRRRYAKSRRPVSVRVLSAYRNQRRQLEAHLFTESSANVSVQVSTVHTSQGSEADIVVFDISDDPAHPFVSNPHDAKHLWCVAVSRAKCQCVLVLSDPQKAKQSNEYIRALFKNAERSKAQ